MTISLPTFSLDGKVALVTGASSGLGQRFARVLNAAGAKVAITARRADRLEALAAEMPGTLAISGDIAVAEDRERIVAETAAHFGTIDVLVNNAGIGVAAPIETERLKDFQKVHEVNVTAPWHLTKLVGPFMVGQGSGSVINIASMLGFVGSTPLKQAGYCSSKAAVVNLTRELGLQWARKGVRVNCIAPGWFPTEMTEPMQEEHAQKYLATNIPMVRMGYEHELDGALLLLASEAGSYITGHTLVVDGGWIAR
ncbi:MAG: SDR family NAD(P)-dependent oxidoreductase [Acidimicrobiia bacterium]